MSVRTIDLILDRIDADFMAVGIAHDLASLVAELAEILCVGLEEVVDTLFAGMRIVSNALYQGFGGDDRLIGYKA
jgi:hypothetical protein